MSNKEKTQRTEDLLNKNVKTRVRFPGKYPSEDVSKGHPRGSDIVNGVT